MIDKQIETIVIDNPMKLQSLDLIIPGYVIITVAIVVYVIVMIVMTTIAYCTAPEEEEE